MKIRQLLARHSFLVRYLRLRKARRRVLASQGQALDRWLMSTGGAHKFFSAHWIEPMKMRQKWRRHR
jgi:hypothetical protein